MVKEKRYSLPRDLNHALQVRLSEYGTSLKEIPELPSIIRHYRSGDMPRENLIQALKRLLKPYTVAIPRKGARGGHERIATPDERLSQAIEDVMAIVKT